ncbi:MGMT family protein [bacterium]|nr:MGMT family protein [candidate division CSSED10-310 bacterium]
MKPVPVRLGAVEIPGLGWEAFAVSDRGLVQSISFFRSENDALVCLKDIMAERPAFRVDPEPPADLEWWRDTFLQFFNGGISAADPGRVPLDSRDWKPFQKDIFLALRDNVQWSETISYGELAGLAGYPGAARAVGTAMSQNMCGPFIPCHRVIGARGRIGGYSGVGGLNLKKKLLEIENRCEILDKIK